MRRGPFLRASVPVSYRRGAAFVTRARGCGLEDVRTPVYTLSRQATDLATYRKELGLGLRDAANRIGIRAVELSGLEHGRLVPEDPSDWERMMGALET